MRNAAPAQWVLSLVTGKERAASVIGDLLETSAGAPRIWTTVLSSMARTLDFRMFTLATGAFFAQFFFPVLPAAAWWVTGLFPSHAAFLFLALGTQLPIGYGIAPLARNAVPMVCLVVAALDCVVGLLRVNNVSINMALWAIPLLAAAAVARHRAVVRQTG